MKKYNCLMLLLVLLLTLSGCLAVKEQAYKFNYETGKFEIYYHDIRSVKGSDDKDDYMAKDWASLKKTVAKKDDYDPAVISVKSKEIFPEGEVLSGKAVYQVQCPKCFPSRTDILKMLYPNEDGRWEVINNEIFLIFPIATHLVCTNGQVVRTGKSIICVWPEDAKKFEFAVSEEEVNGESLLGLYKAELKK